MTKDEGAKQYTCNEYRQEMILAALQRQFRQAATEEERRRLLEEIRRLEEEMGL